MGPREPAGKWCWQDPPPPEGQGSREVFLPKKKEARIAQSFWQATCALNFFQIWTKFWIQNFFQVLDAKKTTTKTLFKTAVFQPFLTPISPKFSRSSPNFISADPPARGTDFVHIYSYFIFFLFILVLSAQKGFPCAVQWREGPLPPNPNSKAFPAVALPPSWPPCPQVPSQMAPVQYEALLKGDAPPPPPTGRDWTRLHTPPWR